MRSIALEDNNEDPIDLTSFETIDDLAENYTCDIISKAIKTAVSLLDYYIEEDYAKNNPSVLGPTIDRYAIVYEQIYRELHKVRDEEGAKKLGKENE